MKKKLKLISVVNFVRGGKSSISRLLAEKLGTSILNFDPKRDSEHYNVIKTTNVLENSTITKVDDYLELETENEIMQISSKTNFFICDFGGRFDERIGEFESDLYILPTMFDYESISETIRATKYILKHNPKAKIVHILNMAMCSNAKEKAEFREGYLSNIETNRVYDINYLEMPKSSLVRDLVNKGVKRADIIGNNQFLAKGGHRHINKFVNDLVDLIEKEMEV